MTGRRARESDAVSETKGKSLHLSVCDCPHVNVVITNSFGQLEAHIAFGADQAEAVARDLMAAAAECRAKQKADPVGVPRGKA